MSPSRSAISTPVSGIGAPVVSSTRTHAEIVVPGTTRESAVWSSTVADGARRTFTLRVRACDP